MAKCIHNDRVECPTHKNPEDMCWLKDEYGCDIVIVYPTVKGQVKKKRWWFRK